MSPAPVPSAGALTRRALLVGAPLLLVRCGSSLPTPVGASAVADQRAGFNRRSASVLRPGERFTVAVRLRGLRAGELTATVGPSCRLDGRRAVPVQAAGRSTALVGAFRDVWVDARSLIDVGTGLPCQTRTHKKLRRLLLIEVERDGDRFRWRRRRQERPPTTGVRSLPGPAHDLLSFLAMLRGWRPEVRPQAQTYLLVDRRLWLVDVMYRGPEVLESRRGQRPAVRYDGVAQRVDRDGKPRRSRPLPFSLWIADEEHRAPLRLVLDTKYGDVSAELREYRRGTGSAAASDAGACPRVAVVSPDEIEERPPRAAHRGRGERVPSVPPTVFDPRGR